MSDNPKSGKERGASGADAGLPPPPPPDNPSASQPEATSLDRSTYLGSSDAAPIAGLSKWSSPGKVWLQKVGLDVDDRPPTLRMWLGERLEPIVLELYAAKTGREPERVVDPDAPPILHPEYPFIGAHPDYERLEIKTSRSAYGWGDDGETATLSNLVIPVGYFAQVQHQNAVMGWDWSDVAVLIGHDDIRTYRVPADADFIGRLILAEVEFWGYVERNEPPPDDDPEGRAALLKALYPEDTEPPRPATPEELMTLAEWRQSKTAEKQAKAAAEMAALAVREMVGAASGLIGEVTYKAQRSRRIDPTAVRNEVYALALTVPGFDPEDFLARVTKTTTSRVLRDTNKETPDDE